MSLGSTTGKSLTVPACCIGGAANLWRRSDAKLQRTGPRWSWALSLADVECVVQQPRFAVGTHNFLRCSAAVPNRALTLVTLVVRDGRWRWPRVPSLGGQIPAGNPSAHSISGV